MGSAGVKGVRIGMDGKTPPTTSVVIDLEKPLAYELTPGPAGKVILTLHTQEAAPSIAKTNVAPTVSTPVAKAASSSKPVVVAVAKPGVTPAMKPVPAIGAKPVAATAAKPGIVAVSSPAITSPKVQPAQGSAPKLLSLPFKAQSTQAKVAPLAKTLSVTPISAAPASKAAAPVTVAKSVAVPSSKTEASVAKTEASVAKTGTPSASTAALGTSEAGSKASKPEEKKWAMTGKRDPFFSPVVQQNGSGCSSGKKCLEIGAINLRGVVKSDTGFIAVVTNSLNKAYFLRENDPVFNGYVVKITGDSVVFQETIQDKLGKSFTREVVKRIFTPAV